MPSYLGAPRIFTNHEKLRFAKQSLFRQVKDSLKSAICFRMSIVSLICDLKGIVRALEEIDDLRFKISTENN